MWFTLKKRHDVGLPHSLIVFRNVNDEEYLRFAEDVRAGASPLGTLIQYPAPPRTWSVRAGYHF